jgi:hypothetical protein
MQHQFCTPKTIDAIAYKHRWHHLLLLSLSFAPHIVRLEVPVVNSEASLVLKLTMDNGFEHTFLAFESVPPVLPAEQWISRSTFVKSQTCRSASEVWAARHSKIDFEDRNSIIDLMERRRRLSIASLAGETNMALSVATRVAAKLVCEGTLDLDCSRPLSPSTEVNWPRHMKAGPTKGAATKHSPVSPNSVGGVKA